MASVACLSQDYEAVELSDIPNRDELERRLSRKLGKLNRVQLSRLLEYLGDPPKMENVPQVFWDEAGRELAQTLGPFLEDVYIEQSLEMMNSQPIGIDWAVVNQGAVNWARDYSFNLVSGINDTSRTALQATVGAYYERGQTIGQLTDRLSGIFGPVRAELIATTEITRAAVEGERAIVRELNKQGVQMVPIWNTNEDSLVCPLCGPRANKEITDGIYPPLHPRCRCWVTHTFREKQ